MAAARPVDASSRLLILRALPEQAGLLTAIAFAAKRHWGYPEAWIQEWAALLTITPDFMDGAEVWCAQVEGELAGFVALSYDGPRALLEHLWVLPHHMGKGIGRALFEVAREQGHAHGCSVLEIESDPNARDFYEKMGARQVGTHEAQIAGQPRTLPMLEIEL